MTRSAANQDPSAMDDANEPTVPLHFGALIGTLVELYDGLVVEFPAPGGEVLRRDAQSAVLLGPNALGHPVVLVFIGGQLDRPVITGHLPPGSAMPKKLTRSRELVLDGRELVLEADATLTLRCGKSSITLTREGRIVLRGTTLVSHASSVNRIRGGTIALN